MHLRLVFDFGFERQEMVFTDQNFLTGQFHDVRIERFDQGRKLSMKVSMTTLLELSAAHSTG